MKTWLKCMIIGAASGVILPGYASGSDPGPDVIGLPVIFHKDARVLFQGDSITDGGRDYKAQYLDHALGHGYPYIIAANACGHYPELNLTFLNRGISGNKVSDLAARWQNDVIALKPDLLSILIGVNDVWHNLGAKKGIPFDEIEATYEKMLTDTGSMLPGTKIVLCEPFILRGSANTKQWAEWDAAIKKIQQMVARLGEKHKCPVVHFQRVFDEAVKRAPAEYWLFDGVHPAWAGHQILADEWLRVVKEYWPRES
ncbi:MAG: SGNH/GDSL hydrolase family protein [Verrucomicrobiota bacterium]